VRLGVVDQVCIPSYLEGGDWEDEDLRPAWAQIGQNVCETQSQPMAGPTVEPLSLTKVEA
jgi:hypothetical protein